jgi:hypothetical protein
MLGEKRRVEGRFLLTLSPEDLAICVDVALVLRVDLVMGGEAFHTITTCQHRIETRDT